MFALINVIFLYKKQFKRENIVKKMSRDTLDDPLLPHCVIW